MKKVILTGEDTGVSSEELAGNSQVRSIRTAREVFDLHLIERTARAAANT